MSLIAEPRPRIDKRDGWPETTGNVYISAPRKIDLTALREALKRLSYTPISADELPLAGKLEAVIREAILNSDLVIIALSGQETDLRAVFEIGVAAGLGKPAILWMLPGPNKITVDILSVRAVLSHDLNDADKLTEELGKVIPGIMEAVSSELAVPTAKPLGSRADDFRSRFEASSGAEYRSTFCDLLSEMNLRWYAGLPEDPIDVVVWSEDWSPWLLNPLAIRIGTNDRLPELAESIQKFSNALDERGLHWGLLLLPGNPSDLRPSIRETAPRVLPISHGELCQQLVSLSFPRIVVRLRNQRVHGEG